VGVGVWGGDTRPIVTQKYTFHLEALTDRFAPMRPRHARADDQCWICLDGDTEGREVRPSSRLVVARRDDAPNATRRARTEIISSSPNPSLIARKRANARTERISRSTPIRIAIGQSRAWSMGLKKSFLWEISRGRFGCVIHEGQSVYAYG